MIHKPDDIKNKKGETAFMIAIRNKNRDIIDILTEYLGLFHLITYTSKGSEWHSLKVTILHYLIRDEYNSIIDNRLRVMNIDSIKHITTMDTDSYYLHYAIKYGIKLDIIKIIIKFTDIDMIDNNCATPLLLALKYNREDVFTTLIDEKADPYRFGAFEESSLLLKMYIRQKEMSDDIKLLKNKLKLCNEFFNKKLFSESDSDSENSFDNHYCFF